MNRDLMEFVFKDTTVRVTDIDGNPMPFILDIARALQYKRSDRQCNNWISRLSKIRLFDIRNKKRYLTHGGSSLPLSELNNIVVDEQSTYYLIQKATTPIADEFQWAFSDFLTRFRRGQIVSKDQLELLKLRVREKELTAEIARLENEKIDFEKKKIEWEKEKRITDLLIGYSRSYPKQISEESQQALEAQALIILSPESADIIKTSLPSIEKEYIAKDISKTLWKKYKIEASYREIGKVAKELGIKSDPELCRSVPYVFYDEEKKRTREEIQFRYKETAKDMIIRHYTIGLITLEVY